MKVQLQSINPPNPMRSRNSVATVKILIHCDPVHRPESGTITIDDVTVMRTEGELWLSMPRTKIVGAWIPVVTLSTRMKLAVNEAVLPLVEKWLLGQTTEHTPQGLKAPSQTVHELGDKLSGGAR